MDNNKVKEYLSGLKIIPDAINIRTHENRQYIKYTELLTPYYYLTCQVVDSTKQISFQLLYQTYKIDSTNINTFNKLCDSFSFEIL